jgi:hypothetical protein
MTLVIEIPEKDASNVSDFHKVKAGKKTPVFSSSDIKKENLKAELKEALNDAFDITEGKKPRKTLKDIFNG